MFKASGFFNGFGIDRETDEPSPLAAFSFFLLFGDVTRIFGTLNPKS